MQFCSKDSKGELEALRGRVCSQRCQQDKPQRRDGWDFLRDKILMKDGQCSRDRIQMKDGQRRQDTIPTKDGQRQQDKIPMKDGQDCTLKTVDQKRMGYDDLDWANCL
mmetsp:Transcript_18084/g.28449  ORF Transcript_18084/g.28449 Transcript_18084/m.28449 type:complete len:108 (+) Transcript_18084:143-466(+)